MKLCIAEIQLVLIKFSGSSNSRNHLFYSLVLLALVVCLRMVYCQQSPSGLVEIPGPVTPTGATRWVTFSSCGPIGLSSVRVLIAVHCSSLQASLGCAPLFLDLLLLTNVSMIASFHRRVYPCIYFPKSLLLLTLKLLQVPFYVFLSFLNLPHQSRQVPGQVLVRLVL